MIFVISTLTLLVTGAQAASQLLNAQVVFRHGDRTPLRTIKSDPYQEDFWGVPWGTLTPTGMAQQYRNGLKLKARYIDQYKLLNETWKSNEIIVRSALTDRCIVSAESSTAGFYSASSYRPTVSYWPAGWAPIPIHTNTYPDREFEPGQKCDRVDVLYVERAAKKGFLAYQAQHADIIETIAKHSGESLINVRDFADFLDTLVCERDHNLTLPDWVTPTFFQQCEDYKAASLDYINGMAGFGEPEETEMVRLRGGPLLESILSNLVANGSRKFYVNSAHDTTIAALLYTFGAGAKIAAMGKMQPDYAATLAFELWELDDGSLGVKVLYSKNADDTFTTITSAINGCPNSDYCPVPQFIERSKKYIPKDMVRECF